MPDIPESAGYDAGVRDAYLGELVAERLYRELARRAADPLQREKFDAIADVEQRTARVLAPLARRRGIESAPADIESRAAQRLATHGALSFDAFIAQAAERWPPYIRRFEELARGAPREDADALQVLVAHERALVRFVEIERGAPGGRQSLQPLIAWLALMPRPPAA